MNPETSSLPQPADLDACSGHSGEGAVSLLPEPGEEVHQPSWAQFKRLLQGIEQLSTAKTCGEVLKIIHWTALNIAASDGVLLVLSDGSQYRYVSGDELVPLLTNPRFPLISCISEWVMQHCQTAVISDVAADERVPRGAYEPTFVKSLIMVPSGSGKDAIAIGAYWIHSHRPEQREVEIFEALARSTSTALRNIELQRALREKEEFYRTALASGRIGTWDINLETEECEISPILAELMGFSPEQSLIQAAQWREVIAADHRPLVAAALAAAVERNAPFDLHFRITLPDGTERWLSSRGGVVRDASGKAVRMQGTAVDITERKKTEEALRASEERQRLIFESAREFAIFTTDPELRVTSWNTGAERLLGYSEAELLGQDSRIVFTPEDRTGRQPEWEEYEAFRKGRASDERWHVRKDGTRFWGSGLAMPLRDASGNIRGMLKILRDRTEKRRVEEGIRMAEERFRTLIKGVKDYAIFTLDAAGRVSDWNEGAEHTTGYTAAEVIGREISSFLYPPEALAEHIPESQLQNAIDHGRSENESWRVRKDGTRFWANEVTTALRDKDGTLIGFTQVSRDLTTRRQAEEALREAHAFLEERVRERTAQLQEANTALELEVNERKQAEEALGELNETLRTLIDASPLAIVALDLKGDITMWNRAAERIFGWQAEEVLEGPLPNIPQLNHEQYTCHLAELFREGGTWEGLETRRQRKDGTVIEVSIWGTPVFNAQGERTGSMALVADISERKWLERALLEATEHEQRRIGQDLHDGLCQSLAGTSLMIKVLAKNLHAEGNLKAAEAEELGDILLQTADQARQIAHGLHPVELETGGLQAILQRLTISANRTVHCELQCTGSVYIKDREKALHLYRIAQEAVDNAVEHADAQHIWITLTSTPRETVLEVKDDGCGFSPKRNTFRTSLGLATMHYRASAIGATLSIESHPGEGTSVQCRLSTKQS